MIFPLELLLIRPLTGYVLAVKPLGLPVGGELVMTKLGHYLVSRYLRGHGMLNFLRLSLPS